MSTNRAFVGLVLVLIFAAGRVSAQGMSVLGADVAKYVTATNDGAYAWYERGFNPSAPASGLPPAGVIVADSAASGTGGPTGTFLLQPYNGNNTLLLNLSHTAGTLTFATPTSANAIWIISATGLGPAHLDTVTHFADGAPDFTQNFFSVPDWFSSTPNVFGAGGRVQIEDIPVLSTDAGSFNAVGSTVPWLAITTIVFPNPTLHLVSSIDLRWEYSSAFARSPYLTSNTAVFGVSVSSNGAVGPFNAAPLTAGSFNQDLVVEASASQAIAQVPEPISVVPALAAMVLLGRRRRENRAARLSLSESLEHRRLMSATWTVTSAADDSAAGTLRNLIGVSSAGDVIMFDPAVFSPVVGAPHVITLSGSPIDISKSLTIQGPGPDVAWVSGNNTTRALILESGVSLTISGLTVANCNNTADTSGGAVLVNSGASLSVSSSVFANNKGNQGGAIYNLGSCSATSSVFSSNTATNPSNSLPGGGAITSFGALNVSGCDFSSNTAVEGGAIDVYYLRPPIPPATVLDSTFENNTATGHGFGGGAISSEAGLQVSRSTFTGNSSLPYRGGGAVSVSYGGPATIDSSRFSNNSALTGGALSVLLSNVDVLNSTLDANTASQDGGGVWAQGTVTLKASTISRNSAGSGGGLYNNSSTMTLINSTVANNTTGGAGGGVYNAGTLASTNTTITRNVAYTAGGIYNSGSSTTLYNTIVAANSILPPQPFSQTQQLIDIVGTVGGSFNMVGPSGTGGLITSNYNIVGVTDPLLSPLGDYGGPTQTVALPPGSLAFNTGYGPLAVDENGTPLPTDQRGVPRVGSSSVDMGAYEAQAPQAVVSNLTALAGTDQVTLSWNSNGSDGGFSIFRGASPGGEDAVPIATATSNAYIDVTPLRGVTYYYRVASSDAAGYGSPSNEVSLAAIPLAPLTSSDGVSGFTFVRDVDSIHVDWTAGANSGQFPLADANPVTVMPNAGMTQVYFDYARGGVIPRVLRLDHGTFRIAGTLSPFEADFNDTLDIGTSTVYVAYVNTVNQIGTIASAVQNGYHGGAWDQTAPLFGSSVISSAVSSGPPGKYSVGYADSADRIVTGQPANTIEIRFTVTGDANLDGVVDMTDATLLQANYNATNTPAWDRGNFDYDAKVGANDAILMARNWLATIPVTPTPTVATPVISTPTDSTSGSSKSDPVPVYTPRTPDLSRDREHKQKKPQKHGH